MELDTFRIELATRKDVPLILSLIRELADHESMTQDVTADEENLANCLSGPHPRAEVIIGYYGSEVVSYALFFPDFSSFSGATGNSLGRFVCTAKYAAAWHRALNDGAYRQACARAQLLPHRLARNQNQSVGR